MALSWGRGFALYKAPHREKAGGTGYTQGPGRGPTWAEGPVVSSVLQLRAQWHASTQECGGEVSNQRDGPVLCVSNQLKSLGLREVKNLPKGPQLVNITARIFSQADLPSKG